MSRTVGRAGRGSLADLIAQEIHGLENVGYYEFSVLGNPQPKGSARAFVVKGRPVITSANPKAKNWAQDIRTAIQNWPHGVLNVAFNVQLSFTFARPASVSEKKRPDHTVKPDADKLIRTVLDALTGICWKDDAQVTSIQCWKRYGVAPGLEAQLLWEVT